jgi:hypothetical protein
MNEIKKINLEYSATKTLLPDIGYFLDKLKNDEIIRFLRVNHGFIDGVHWGYENTLDFEKDFKEKKYELIAEKIVHGYYDKKWGLAYWHKLDDFLIKTVGDLIRLLREYEDVSEKIDIALSLGVGLNQFWGVHGESHPVQDSRTKFSHILGRTVNKNFFYSGIFKHYTIKGEINQLFEVLNDKDYNVIFLGPDYFGKHKNVFNIKNWNFIEIPLTDAMSNVEEYLSEINNIHEKSNKPSIVFLQCGHIMAANIIETMLDTDISFIDIGRSFDILIKEEFVDGNQSLKCWTGLNMKQLNEYVDNLRK